MGDPVRIDAGSVKRCALPAPSAALFRDMAAAAYDAAREGDNVVGVKQDGKTEDLSEVPWDKLDPDNQDALIVQAKAAYGAIAMHARALCESIPEQQNRATKYPPAKGGL